MRGEVFGVDDALVDDRVAVIEAMSPWADDRAMAPDQLARLCDRTLAAHGG
jgi:hypothetical protein